MTTIAMLPPIAERFLLLAGQAEYVHMGRRFRRGGGEFEWTDVLLPLGIIGVVISIAWIVTQYLKHREHQMQDSSQGLFAELCQAHGLDWANQQLMRALANAHRLPSPVQLFVEPERFDTELLGHTFANRQQQVEALRSRLFGEPTAGTTEVS
ncbi:MAG: hypothetical protein H6822_20125 [Planctomycetaceae bacterium]|nr:hypothetical protein [Planctomycetales bacterium]MCB9924497.1 hypothetical protein [Planctomycetaceae bacterium]